MRDAAQRRYQLGYPPRKPSDTSIGDAINWEWLIRCAQTTENSNVLIVSRDGDYGLTEGDDPTLNDWLKAEFEARVKPTRKIELTNRLTVALKRLAEVVSPEDEAAEKSVLEAPSPVLFGNVRNLTDQELQALLDQYRFSEHQALLDTYRLIARQQKGRSIF